MTHHDFLPGHKVTDGRTIGTVIGRGAHHATYWVKVRNLLTGTVHTYINDQISTLRRV